MAINSAIEWTDASWNPVTGCTEISPGCDHCYAKTFAERWRGIPGHPYEQGFDLKLWPERLALPFTWKKPRRIFVNSMSDLFHKRVPFEFIEQVFDTMWRASHHTFQVLTKRPERLVDFYTWHARRRGYSDDDILARRGLGTIIAPFNVWIGTSIESDHYTHRADDLCQVPAAVRFLSCEPLLGAVDVKPYICICAACMRGNRCGSGIHWLIVGGESGHNARPMRVDWARSLVQQCQATGVALFVKQLGSVWAKAYRQGGRPIAGLGDTKGGDMQYWPEDLRVREFPNEVPV